MQREGGPGHPGARRAARPPPGTVGRPGRGLTRRRRRGQQVDRAALDQQVMEKKKRMEEAAATDLQYAKMADFFDQKVCMLAQEQKRKETDLKKGVRAFHVASQKMESRREYDLNDPNARKNTVHYRAEGGTALGASSLQVLAGEDVTAGERKVKQMAQQMAYIEGQKAEKAARVKAEKDLESMYSAQTMAQETMLEQIAKSEASARTANSLSVAKTNSELAQIAAERKRAEKEHEEKLNEYDIGNVQDSFMMTENPALAVNVEQPWRVRGDHWKGMSKEQLDGIRLEQEAQRAAMAATRAAEAEAEAAWAHQQRTVLNARAIAEIGKERQVRSNNSSQLAALMGQREEKKHRDAQLNETYSNRADASYFAQFGTSHR